MTVFRQIVGRYPYWACKIKGRTVTLGACACVSKTTAAKVARSLARKAAK